jgi:hypothetical protein
MERTELVKQRNVELTRIAGKQLEKDLEKHAMAKEASLFQLLATVQESLAKARDTLRAIMSENGNDSDSELANEAKVMIDFYMMRRNKVMADLQRHETDVASEPKQRLVPKNPKDDEVIGSSSSSSSAESSLSESSLGYMASQTKKPRKKCNPFMQKNTP